MAMSKDLKTARKFYDSNETGFIGLHNALVALIVSAARAMADESVSETEAFAELTVFNRYMDEKNKTDFQRNAVRSWFGNVCKFRVKDNGEIRPKRGLVMNSDWLENLKGTTWFKHANDLAFKIPEIGTKSMARDIAKLQYLGQEFTAADERELLAQLRRDIEAVKNEKGYKEWVEKADREIAAGRVVPFKKPEAA